MYNGSGRRRGGLGTGGGKNRSNREIGRREFLQRSTALGASGVLLPGLLGPRAATSAPKKGGRLVVGAFASVNDGLDPARFNSAAGHSAGLTAYDTLTDRAIDLRPTPALAESWEANADATQWTFKLRKDVVYHDGKQFDADDIIYSYSRIIAPDSPNPLKTVFAHVKEIRKDGPHTVKFVLESPDVEFPVACADHRSAVVRSGYSDFTRTTVGTGPFKVKSFDPGNRYRFERNDDYWSDEGPWVDEIEFLGIADPTTRLNALLSGDIDLLGGLDPKGLELIERREDVDLITADSSTPVSLTMMMDRAPSNNADLRLALKYASDRQRIVDVVYKGLAHVGNDHAISPILPFHCDEIAQRPYDPERARHHIRKAGLENVRINVHTSDVYPGQVAATEVFQESAAQAGIRINIVRVPADTYWDTAWMIEPIFVAYWDARPTVNVLYSTVFASDAPWNESAWKNERFDRLLVEARATFDEGKRQEMYCEMQQLLQDHGGHATWAHVNYTDARHTDIKGITPHPSGNFGFFRFARTVWLDR